MKKGYGESFELALWECWLPFCSAAGDACVRLSSLPTTVTLDAAALSCAVRTRPPRPAAWAARTRSSDRISFLRSLCMENNHGSSRNTAKHSAG